MKPAIDMDYSLYLVTDSAIASRRGKSIEAIVEAAIKGGCTLVQLREKEASSLSFYRTGVAIREITGKYGVPLIVNDRVDIALAIGADGVHIGQKDLPAHVVREIIGGKMVLGVSAATLEEGKRAKADGADYLGVGAMFPTDTKTDARAVTPELLRQIKAETGLPTVAIGGLNQTTIPALKGTGVDGVAVVSAIVGAEDVTAAARDIARIFKEL